MCAFELRFVFPVCGRGRGETSHFLSKPSLADRQEDSEVLPPPSGTGSVDRLRTRAQPLTLIHLLKEKEGKNCLAAGSGGAGFGKWWRLVFFFFYLEYALRVCWEYVRACVSRRVPRYEIGRAIFFEPCFRERVAGGLYYVRTTNFLVYYRFICSISCFTFRDGSSYPEGVIGVWFFLLQIFPCFRIQF